MLLKVVLVLILMVMTQVQPTPLKEEQEKEGSSNLDRLSADTKIRKDLDYPANAGNQGIDSENQRFETEQGTSNSAKELAELAELASEDDKTSLAELEDKVLQNEEIQSLEEDDASNSNDENESEELTDEDTLDAPIGGSKTKRNVQDTNEAEQDEEDGQEDDEYEESSVDHEYDKNVNDDHESDGYFSAEDSGLDDVSKENDVFLKDPEMKINDENEDSGKDKREIVAQIDETLSEVQSVDNYLDYLTKRADKLDEFREDLRKYSGNRKVETDRSKRESSRMSNDHSVDELRYMSQYRDGPRETVANADQFLNNGDRISRHSELKEPVQRQACSESSTPVVPVSPCVGTTKEPLTKEEQELEKVIELRKKHEANVAKEQDEVVKAEHMAHTLQEDLQEVMNEIRQLKKEIKIERKDADAISIELKEDQKDLEQHDQLKFNARRKVDDLYMKLTELESSDCEARSKRQLPRQMSGKDGYGSLVPYDYETPRQRILRGIREKEFESDRARRERIVEKLAAERQLLGQANDVQDAQKQTRELQRAEIQENDQQKVDDSVQSQQQDQYEAKEADNMDPVVGQINDLVQRSVNAQAQPQPPAQAPAHVSAMPRQASSECTTPKVTDDHQKKYNAILQEIIIGEAKVKIESVEVERAEAEVATSRKRMATAMSQLAALVLELKNLQARAINAGKRAKDAHKVLAYHDQLLFAERRKVIEAQTLETDLMKMISDLKTKVSNKCSNNEPKS